MKKMKHYKRVIPFFTLLVILIGLILILFFPNVVNYFNHDSYEEIEVKVVEKGYDGLLSVIPRIKVNYKYDGVSYSENIILYNGWFFNEDIGNKCKLFINKNAPKYSIYLFNPLSLQKWMYPLFIVSLICLFIIVRNTIMNIKFALKKSNKEVEVSYD